MSITIRDQARAKIAQAFASDEDFLRSREEMRVASESHEMKTISGRRPSPANVRRSRSLDGLQRIRKQIAPSISLSGCRSCRNPRSSGLKELRPCCFHALFVEDRKSTR